MSASAKHFNYYVWLAGLVYSAKSITREDINRNWAVSSLNDTNQKELPDRTFFRWKQQVSELLGVEIRFSKITQSYYLDDPAGVLNQQHNQWLLRTFAMTNNLMNESTSIQDRILLEDIPSDAHFLMPIVEAMRLNRKIEMSYLKFGDSAPQVLVLAPYCVKVFKQRWYVVGKSSNHPEGLRVYALDRIQDLHLLEKSFRMPKKFDAKAYFWDYYGVFTNKKAERVRVRVQASEANYLRSLPVHHSQKEVERTADYSVFEFYVGPARDFIIELRTYGANLRVLEPQWLVDEFRQLAEDYNKIYQ